MSYVLKFKIDDEDAHDLTLQYLKNSFEDISADIIKIKYHITFQQRDTVELTRLIQCRDALQIVLKNMMNRDDYLEFMELQRTYGYVQ